MALIVNDRVRESTTVTGTGTATLLGAIAGYQAFSVIGNGNTCYYTISDQLGANWEVGIGTYTLSGTTLARTTVLKSSNANNLVSFTAGTKDVFVTYPAGTSVSGGGGGTYPTIQPSLNLDFANTKLLDPRITFVRNSTAAYYDGQTSALAEQNLLPYSIAPSTAYWVNGAVGLTTGQTAPDGTTTASLAISSATSTQHYSALTPAVVGGSLGSVLSIYAKPNGTTKTQICVNPNNNSYSANFDVLNGVVISNTGCVASMVSVGNGWYRCILVATTNVFNSCYIWTEGTTSSVAGDGVNGFYLWGAQLEQRSAVTAYTPTTTAAITNYIPVLMTAPDGVARFDCDPITGKSLGLLIEESRTNLLTYSSDFSNAVWSKSNATVTSAANVTPDGTLTANKFIPNTTQVNASFSQSTSVTSGTTYTHTFYAKAGEQVSVSLVSNIVTAYRVSVFNLSTGTVTTTASGWVATMSSIGNGWYRCSSVFTATASATVAFQVSNNSTGWTGDGYSGIYIWGAQLEAGAFSTSYIPTVASTVTRAADVASMTGTNFSSWYNQAQGSFYGEASPYVIVGLHYIASARNASATDAVCIGFSGNTGILYAKASNIDCALLYSGTSFIDTFSKMSGTYKRDSFNFVVNLGDVVTDISGQIPIVDQLLIGNFTGSNILNGHIKKLSYYPVALSSSSLVALTS